VKVETFQNNISDISHVAPLPGTVNVAQLPGTVNVAPLPGTVNVAPLPGTVNVAPLPGTVNAVEANERSRSLKFFHFFKIF